MTSAEKQSGFGWRSHVMSGGWLWMTPRPALYLGKCGLMIVHVMKLHSTLLSAVLCLLSHMHFRHQTYSTRTTEVRMYWWKSGQHSYRNRNQVWPIWCCPSWWQKWIEGKGHGQQILLWRWTNQHRNSPWLAFWKRCAASNLDHPFWNLAWHQSF